MKNTNVLRALAVALLATVSVAVASTGTEDLAPTEGADFAPATETKTVASATSFANPDRVYVLDEVKVVVDLSTPKKSASTATYSCRTRPLVQGYGTVKECGFFGS